MASPSPSEGSMERSVVAKQQAMSGLLDLVNENDRLRERIRILERELEETHVALSRSEGVTVANAYVDKTLFLTGATGFIGTLVLEKILRTCPDVKKVLILCRAKRGKTPYQRLVGLMESPAFDLLRREWGTEFRERMTTKVQVLPGDIEKPDFGMDSEAQEHVRFHVDYVIHCAASIRFNTPLPDALRDNYISSVCVLELAKKCVALRGLVYVSTCYVNAHLAEENVLEKIYPSGIDRDKLLERAWQLNPDDCETYSKRIQKKFKFPNVYTLTKHVTEEMFEENHGDLTVAIVRPSIVTGVLRDPVQGWVGNRSGLSGVVLGIGTGLINFLPGNEETELDIVPGDMVANLVVVSIPMMSEHHGRVQVYHVCSSSVKPITIQDISKPVVGYYKDHPIEGVNKHVSFELVSNKISAYYMIQTRRFKLFIASFMLRLMRQWKRYSKVDKIKGVVAELMSLNYFTSHKWTFETHNTQRIFKKLTAEDRQIFPLLPTDIDWEEYLWLFIAGCTSHLLPESLRSPHPARAARRSNASYWAIATAILVALVVCLLIVFFIQY